jgi:hypothetical protein
MRIISPNEISAVSGASGFLTTVVGRVDNVLTQTGGALVTTGLSLNDTLFSVVQLQGADSSLELTQLSKLI